MHNWMKKAVTRLIAAFFGVVALLPNGKVLVPQIELLEEVTTASEEIVYQVCNEKGWYFHVESFTLEKQEADGAWRTLPAEIAVPEVEPVFVLVSNYISGQAATCRIPVLFTFGGYLKAGHYRLSIMQNYGSNDVLAALEFDVTEAAS